MIFACVPTAASGFTLARQMGGDAPLAAAIVTLQTAVSFVFLPLVIVLLGGYFGVTP
jgi:malonate transporter